MKDIELKKKLRVDFHCHSSYSRDSLTKPEMLVKMCLRKGLDRIVVTDHNTIEGALEALRLDPIHIIVGEEIMTTKGEILAAYVQECIPTGLSPLETIQLLRDQGAFISISHPFDQMRKGSWCMEDILPILPLVDAIEGFNARIMVQDANKKALLFAKEYDLAITAGSDAHAAFELGTASILLDPFMDAEELKMNIKLGILASKQSPWWVHLLSAYAKYHNNPKKG
jgi:predicted metal-dependent phosphoesterase TrpH